MLYFRWWIFMKKQYHSMTMSIHITICASGNFSKSIYLGTHLDWNWFRVDYYCDWNWLTVIIDFVSRVARHCKVSSILEIWSYNKSAIAHLTYNDVIRDINQVKTRWANSVWCETVYIKQICLWHKNIVNSRSVLHVHCIELLLCDDFHSTLCHYLFNG